MTSQTQEQENKNVKNENKTKSPWKKNSVSRGNFLAFVRVLAKSNKSVKNFRLGRFAKSKTLLDKKNDTLSIGEGESSTLLENLCEGKKPIRIGYRSIKFPSERISSVASKQISGVYTGPFRHISNIIRC